MSEILNLKNKNSTYEQLFFVKEFVYKKNKLSFENCDFYEESKEYEACTFSLNDKKIIHRTAKITPKKLGQFVSIWKRNAKRLTVPLAFSDDFDFLVITTKDKENFGQFFFPKNTLVKKGIISNQLKGGKRGIRVYPPWVNVESLLAKKSQVWHNKYFVPFEKNGKTNFDFLNDY